MLTFYVNEKTSEGKSLLEFALKLKAPSDAIKIRRKKRQLSDEEMALPGVTPSAEELEEWLTRADSDKGSSGEVVRARLLKKFKKEFPATNK
jgi:hypothetical protein